MCYVYIYLKIYCKLNIFQQQKKVIYSGYCLDPCLQNSQFENAV